MRRLLADLVKGRSQSHAHLLFTHNMFRLLFLLLVLCVLSFIPHLSFSLFLNRHSGVQASACTFVRTSFRSASQANQLQLLAFNVDNRSVSPTEVCRLTETGYALKKCFTEILKYLLMPSKIYCSMFHSSTMYLRQ